MHTHTLETGVGAWAAGRARQPLALHAHGRAPGGGSRLTAQNNAALIHIDIISNNSSLLTVLLVVPLLSISTSTSINTNT